MPRGPSPSSPDRAAAAQRATRVLKMRVHGRMTLQQIADAEGISAAQASRIIKKALAEYHAERVEDAKAFRDELVMHYEDRYQRLYALLSQVGPDKTPVLGVEKRLAVMQRMLEEDDRIAKRLGLDAPARSEVTVRSQPLTTEEIERFRTEATPEELERVHAGDAETIAAVFERAGITMH